MKIGNRGYLIAFVLISTGIIIGNKKVVKDKEKDGDLSN